jgi:hypothetical protein
MPRTSKWILIAACAVLCSLGASVAWAQEKEDAKAEVSAVVLDRVTSWGGGYAKNIVSGWEFETTARVRVTELGVWDTDGKGLDDDMPVKLWDEDGKVLAEATLPKGEKAELIERFRYVKIEPVDLEAGKRFIIGARYTLKIKDGTIQGGANLSLAAPVRWIRHRRAVSDEMTLPKLELAAPDRQELPGSFGPNFRIADSEAARGVRQFYRLRYLPQASRYELRIVPEQEDGSHRDEKYLTVSLYVAPDGKLTQVLFEDLPLGAGESTFADLAKEVQRFRNKEFADRPILRVAAMSKAPAADVRRAINVCESGLFDPDDEGREPHKGEVHPIQGHVMQPQREGKHVAADRFKDFGDYVEDRWTGLLWQKDGVVSGKKNFYQAADYAKELDLGDMMEWRVPTIEELATIYPATYAPFTNTKHNTKQCCGGGEEYPGYWTSQLDKRQDDYAYVYQWYAKGGANNCYASANHAYVRCVHDPVRAEKD